VGRVKFKLTEKNMFIPDTVTAQERLGGLQPKRTHGLLNKGKMATKNKRHKNIPKILNHSSVII
jgi:hypothetical protein